MTALWGGGDASRPLWARCDECGWKGPDRFEPDADAVMLAAADAHHHNVTEHPVIPEGQLF